MHIRSKDFQNAQPVYDKAAIMRQAWQTAKDKREWNMAQDWTPGSSYGAVRPVTTAERRTIFAEALRAAWSAAKFHAEQEATRLAILANPKAQAIFREIDQLQNKSFRVNIAQRETELRHQLAELTT